MYWHPEWIFWIRIRLCLNAYYWVHTFSDGLYHRHWQTKNLLTCFVLSWCLPQWRHLPSSLLLVDNEQVRLRYKSLTFLSMHFSYISMLRSHRATRAFNSYNSSLKYRYISLSHLNAVDSLVWISFRPMYLCATTPIAHYPIRLCPHGIIAFVWFLSIYTFTLCITFSFMLHPFSSIGHFSKHHPFP